MKNFIFVLFLNLSLTSCCFTNSNSMDNSNIKSDIPVKKERLYSDVKEITSTKPARNYENIESLNKAAGYIYDQFQKLSGNVEIQKYKAGDKEYKNIICSFGPMDSERIIIGAHYDVCGEQPGADDNASGVAGLLEIARLINELKPDMKNRIDLVAYSLEEPPFFRTEFMGSSVHAKSLVDLKVKVKVMISLEMLGYFSEKPKSQQYPVFFLKWFYPDKANFIAVVGKYGQGKIIKKIKKYMIQGSNIDVQSLSAPSSLPGIDFSDHLNYWRYGYKAVMITDTSFYRNPNYHFTTDTIETLDFDKMTEVVRGVYWAVVNI
ncbi:MAG: M28 family peptidase [bacterium]